MPPAFSWYSCKRHRRRTWPRAPAAPAGTTAQPHWLYACGIGADGDHIAVTPAAHNYLLALIHFVIERTPPHFLQFFGIFKGAALCPIVAHSSCGLNPLSPQNGHQLDTCEHLVDKDVVGKPAALLQHICEPQHHAGAQVQAATQPGEQRALRGLEPHQVAAAGRATPDLAAQLP